MVRPPNHYDPLKDTHRKVAEDLETKNRQHTQKTVGPPPLQRENAKAADDLTAEPRQRTQKTVGPPSPTMHPGARLGWTHSGRMDEQQDSARAWVRAAAVERQQKQQTEARKQDAAREQSSHERPALRDAAKQQAQELTQRGHSQHMTQGGGRGRAR